MLLISYFCVAFIALNSASAQYPIPDNKTCDQLCNSTKNFNHEDISGIYFIPYEIPYTFLIGSKCTYLNYTRFNESFFNFTIFERRIDDNSDKITDGYFTYAENGDMIVKYTNLDLLFHFKVVGLDADTFALIHCTECGMYSKKGSGLYIHIHTRIPYPSCESLDQLMDEVAACGIPRDAIPQVDHSSCQRTC